MRVLVAIAIALGMPALQPDAARVLADMRQALGGDAAIASVKALSVSASEAWKFQDVTVPSSVEWSAILPDSVVRVRRISQSWGIDVTIDGFRGDARILRGNGAVPDANPNDGTSPAEHGVRDAKHRFSRLTMALIGPSAVDPVDVSYAGQRTVAGRLCDVLRLRAPDGYDATLAVDAATHLPVSVTWMAPQVTPVTIIVESTVVVPQGVPPESIPPPRLPPLVPGGGPPAGLVERQILFDDFKAVDGLNWPHRFTESIEGRLWSTTRVSKYKLNPKIDPKVFDPARR